MGCAALMAPLAAARPAAAQATGGGVRARIRIAVSTSPRSATSQKSRRGLLREAEPVRVRFIEAEKAHHTVRIMCRCLNVTTSGFYAWRGRPESTRNREDRRFKVLIGASFKEGRGSCGSPRAVKSEIGERFDSNGEAKMQLFDYIEVF